MTHSEPLWTLHETGSMLQPKWSSSPMSRPFSAPDGALSSGFRSSGRTREFIMPFEGEKSRAFQALVSRCLEAWDIPESTPQMPTFEHFLSRAGGWLFVVSAFGMLAAHALGYHTWGTILGVSF